MAREKTTPPDVPAGVKHVRVPPAPATRPRRSRRRPLPNVLVTVEAPELSGQPWVVDALDLNADGIGLVLPQALRPETDVLLTFSLDERTSFNRVPAMVLHQEGNAGGVRFQSWKEADRLRLLEHLVGLYEGDEEPPR